MGKNSLIKSTTKKKTGTKKSGGAKKKPVKAGESPKAKAVQKPKNAVKAKGASKTKAGTKKTPSTKKKPTSVEELIFKKFEPWKPEKLFRLPPADKQAETFAAPPIISEKNEEELKRNRSILFRKFDFNAFSGKALIEASRVEETAVKTADSGEGADKMPPDEKSWEPTPEASDIFQPPDGMAGSDPAAKFMKYFVAGVVLLIAIIVVASLSNKSKYYVKTSDGAVEIWQGKFAPMGEDLLISLPGAQPPETVKSVYSKAEALPIAFDYYIDKADALLEVSGMPDFNGIKSYLKKALSFAVTEDLRNMAVARLNSIDFMIFLLKADVAAGKLSPSSLEIALGYLKEAALLDLDEKQKLLVNEKIETIRALMAAMEKKPEQAPEAAPETPPAK